MLFLFQIRIKKKNKNLNKKKTLKRKGSPFNSNQEGKLEKYGAQTTKKKTPPP